MRNNKEYDFSGWATKNDIKCSDGRTIRRNAFKDNDGQVVPLVWNHCHNNPEEVLGHALLENRKDGVYTYCTFNNTEAGKTAKELVHNGDVNQLSIYANKLKSNMGDVIHGCIREVSLVLAGANPGAFIDTVIEHSDSEDESAVIYTDEEIIERSNDETIEHSDEEVDTEAGDKESTNNKEEEMDDSNKKEETIEEIFDTLSDKQKDAVYAVIGAVVEDEEENEKDEEGDDNMKHNVFENDEQNETLFHSEIVADAIADAKKYGSMKESFIEHAAANNIENIDFLFPDAKELNNPPTWIKENEDWVRVIMNNVKRSPFSRVKTTFAKMDETTARAKGYIKGNMKKDIALALLRRVTTPTTVYTKAKIDRDDVVDITSFDVVSWQKAEMRNQLNKELALAMLLGDGRSVSDEDKINEQNIRPIINDDDMYTIKYTVKDKQDYDSTKPNDSLAKGVIRAAIKSRKDYKGSGKPVFFTTENLLTEMLLIEDANGRRIYKNEEDLAIALRAKEIVTVPEMEARKDIYGVLVNFNDYTAGADKGGNVGFFDDFDIDYNQQKYLMETRMSGALTQPYSAIVLKTEHMG